MKVSKTFITIVLLVVIGAGIFWAVNIYKTPPGCEWVQPVCVQAPCNVKPELYCRS